MTQRQADLLLLSAAFLWGSSYGLMKLGAETLTPVSIASASDTSEMTDVSCDAVPAQPMRRIAQSAMQIHIEICFCIFIESPVNSMLPIPYLSTAEFLSMIVSMFGLRT